MNKNHLELEFPLNLICDLYRISWEEYQKLPVRSVNEEAFDKAWNSLTKYHQYVLQCHFKDRITYTEIAFQNNVPYHRVAHLKRKAFKILKNISGDKLLFLKE